MRKDETKDVIEKWQILGLSLMMMSETKEDFYELVKQGLAIFRMSRLDQRIAVPMNKF